MRGRKPKKQDILADTIPIAITEPAAPKRAISVPWRRIGTILIAAIAGLVVVALSVFAGGYFGLHRGEITREQARVAEADQHYHAGLELLNSGQYELAIAEFEYALELDPGHPYAQQGIDEAQVGIATRPTPTVEVYMIAATDLYQQAVAHYQAGEWKLAAEKLIQLRALDPAFEPAAVEDMLFNSLYNAGMAALLDQNDLRLEEGIFYLDQAEALRDLDEEALQQRDWAERYLTALGYWGVDWDTCIQRFESLYNSAPNYRDVRQRLFNAHVAYADAWSTQGEMCPAQEQYALALQIVSNPAVEQQRADAEQVCLIATPTPIAPIEGSQAITMAELPPGFTAGRLAYPLYNVREEHYDIYALFIDRRLVRMVASADQPSWMWSSTALGYRDQLSPGISMLTAEGAGPQLLVSGSNLSWPTFSPDGQRLAYAAQDAAGTWQIYIAPTDGSSEPTVHAAGKGPTWGSNGWLAWTGCEASGACGIIIDHPNDGQPFTRLSASANDIGLCWSPDGGRLAYMSNHTGDWEVYIVSTSGTFVQLTDDPGYDGLPAWAPDGSGLAFASNRDGAWGIYLMGPNGEDPHKILDLGPSFPDWTMQRLSWAP